MKDNLWFMIKLAWRVRKSAVPLCIVMAVLTAGQTVTELLLAPVILDKVESTAPLRELAETVLLFTGVLAAVSALRAYTEQNLRFGRSDIRRYVRESCGRKMAHTSYENLLDSRFLKLYEKAMGGGTTQNSASEAMWNTLTLLLTSILGFAAYLIILSDLSILLFAVAAVTAVITFCFNQHVGKWGYLHREEEAEYLKRMRYIRRVSIQRSSAKDIRIFGLRDWLDDVWNGAYRLYYGFLMRREAHYLMMNVMDLVLTLLRNGIAYAYLIALVLQDCISVSQFLLYFSAVSGFASWTCSILEQISLLQRQCLEISVWREFIDWPEPFRFEEGSVPAAPDDGKYEITLENVSFRYPGASEDTIHDLNLTIRPGEKVAVVGLNGAGKTTLAKLVCGFLDPTEGRVLLNGTDIRTFNRKEYYKLFSGVFQDFSVLEVSVAENVAQCTHGYDLDRVGKCIRMAGLEDMVRNLPDGLDTHIGRQVFEDGVELSGGQMQRLMLARALYKDAPVLLLDEPTAALDPLAENELYLQYSQMSENKTSLFISHRLVSTRFCDRILYMEKGQITEEGTHGELLALGGGYAKLYEIQSRYYQEGGVYDGEQW